MTSVTTDNATADSEAARPSGLAKLASADVAPGCEIRGCARLAAVEAALVSSTGFRGDPEILCRPHAEDILLSVPFIRGATRGGGHLVVRAVDGAQ